MLSKIAAERSATGALPRVELAGETATVFLHDGHRQTITFRRNGKEYILESTILPSRIVRRRTTREILICAWQRNRITDIVTFDVDARLRLVGRIQQLAETIDSKELEFYIDTLARECDELEYLLTGRDQQ